MLYTPTGVLAAIVRTVVLPSRTLNVLLPVVVTVTTMRWR
jgi:hypothetical protein